MAIENVSGGGLQPFSLEEAQGTSTVSNDGGTSIALPSYLSLSDLDFSPSATGVLGIRMPLSDGIVSDELLLALTENENLLRKNKKHGQDSDAGLVGAALKDEATAIRALHTVIMATEDAEKKKETEVAMRASTQNALTAELTKQATLAGQISNLQSEINVLSAQILMTPEDQRAPLIAQLNAKQSSLSNLSAQKAVVDQNVNNMQGSLAESNAIITDLEGQLVSLSDQYEVIADTQVQLRGGADLIVNERGSSARLDSEENVNNSARLQELLKQLLKGVPLQFWNESNRERVMKTEQTQESKKPSEEDMGQFAAYTIARSDPGDVISNPVTVTNRELDTQSADRAYNATVMLMSNIMDVLKTLDIELKMANQQVAKGNVQTGKVLISLT